DFTGNYSGVLMDLQDIIDRNTNNNMTQVARIMQQYIFWTITDRWGDVPYSEALKGDPTPKYDRQEEIYKGMIATLEDAVNAMDNTSQITGDVIYNGDVSSWKKAANSIRMMMALQLSKVYPAAGGYAATQFSSALNHPAGVIATNAENFDVNYPGGNFPSNWWSIYNGRNDFAESKTLTDLMGTLGDTRQNAFGGATHVEGQPNSDA
ncbi:SusD/RagB family nutrient-binding outer membrane lipoprotein, partial [Pontibacter sp. HJ8]